jgi:hypothetical protein
LSSTFHIIYRTGTDSLCLFPERDLAGDIWCVSDEVMRMTTLNPLASLMVVFASLLLESSECFHAYNNLQIHDASRGAASSLRTSSGSTLTWEEQIIRQEATTALLPVFFPIESNDSIGEVYNNIPITAELALKRLLREKQKTTSNNDSRGRLAALILGTSVMRLHHFYNVVSSQNYFTANLPIPYPLVFTVISLVISLVKTNYSTVNPLNISDAQQYNHSVEEIMLVRAMVDEHARYLSSNSNGTLLVSP